MLANTISLNKTKTELVIFRKKKTAVPLGKITLNGHKLEHQQNTKYVGLILDEHLDFKAHIDILNARLKRANNLLSISRHYVPKEILRQIYYGQFHSHLNYGSQIWTAGNDLQSTIVLQNKAIRIITWSQPRTSSDPLFKQMKIPKLTDMVKMNNLLFVHDVLNDKAPECFSHYFEPTKRQHTHDTVNNPASRHSIPNGSLKMPIVRNQQSIKTVKYSFAKLWNDFIKEISKSNTTLVPSNTFQSMSRYSFKDLIRAYIFAWHTLQTKKRTKITIQNSKTFY